MVESNLKRIRLGSHLGIGSHSGSGSLPVSSPCHDCDCQEFKSIKALGDSNVCVDENKVFVMLKALNDKSHECRKRAIHHLAGVYSSTTDTPSSCRCSGQNTFHHFHSNYNEHLTSCLRDKEFDEFYNRFFKPHSGEPSYSPPVCRSHHAIWETLSHVSTSAHMITKTCQDIIIDHIGTLFESSDPCSCSDNVPTTPTSTTIKHTTTTTKQQPTATTKQTAHHVSSSTAITAPASTGKMSISVRWSCGKLSTIESIALQQHLNQQSATLCGTANQHGSDEAFVLVNCNAPDPSLWKQGVNVMQHCHDIPTYTPVATFIGGTYHPSLAESGVFLGCLNEGFKLGVQHCNSTPTIDHIIRSSSGLQNADLYYVIE